jgi:hypothetical protein
LANVTTNYNLNKPLQEENINIDVLNQNMDIIDEVLASLSNSEISEIYSNQEPTNQKQGDFWLKKLTT